MENATKTVLLCGVGGQGTILAADLLAFSCMKAGLQVKVSEIHGMAQRGGAVTTVVRVGEDVKSMVSDAGCADVVVAFETTEALRNLPQLKEGGSLIVNDVAMRPLPVLTGAASMPENACARPGRCSSTPMPLRGRPATPNAPMWCSWGPWRPGSTFPSRCGRRPWPSACRRRPSRRTSPPCARAEPSSRTRRENSMTVSQISVFANSRPGHMNRVLDLFEGADVSVRGFSAADTGEYGILRFIVDKPEAAMEALKGAGCACVVSPVICLKLVDEPGELSRVMGVLAKCSINVVYSYSMISTYIVLSTSEPERAQALLADEPVELISQEDIARIVAERAAKEA